MRRVFLVLIACLIAFAVFGCTSQPASQPKALPKSISYGSLPAPQSTYVVGVAQGSILKKHLGLDVNIEPVGPAKAQMDRMRTKEVEVGHFDSFAVTQGYWGEGVFKDDGPQDIRLLQSGNYLGFAAVTRPDTGIKSITDLKGKRVHAIWPAAPALEVWGKGVLGAYGMSYDDITSIKYSSTAEYAQEMIQRKVDAFFGNAKARGTMEEMDRAVGTLILPISHESRVVDFVRKTLPSASPITFPKGYPGAKIDTTSIGLPMYFYARADIDNELAYSIVKTLLDHYDELKLIEPTCEEWTLENAVKSVAIPFHPGAIKYYQEKGVWTKELQDLQDRLLARKK